MSVPQKMLSHQSPNRFSGLKAAVAGATGGVGKEIVMRLAAEGVPVRALVRDPYAAVRIHMTWRIFPQTAHTFLWAVDFRMMLCRCNGQGSHDTKDACRSVRHCNTQVKQHTGVVMQTRWGAVCVVQPATVLFGMQCSLSALSPSAKAAALLASPRIYPSSEQRNRLH